MPATVDVVEFALRDRVVDVDRGEEQLAGLLHLVEAVDAGRRFFGDATAVGCRSFPSRSVRCGNLAKELEDHAVFFGIRLGVEVRNLLGLLELESLMDEQRRIATIIDDEFRARPVRPAECDIRAPPVFVEGLALPSEDRNALGIFRRAVRSNDDRGRGMVLSREDVAGNPAHVGAELDQRLDENARLDRHMKAAHHADAVERLGLAEALAENHEAGHLVLCELELLAAPCVEREVGDLERGRVG